MAMNCDLQNKYTISRHLLKQRCTTMWKKCICFIDSWWQSCSKLF